jgi:hypothetical protein
MKEYQHGAHSVFEIHLHKEKALYKLRGVFESLKRQYWGRHMYVGARILLGNVTDEVIKAYIEGQEQADGNFRVSGDE